MLDVLLFAVLVLPGSLLVLAWYCQYWKFERHLKYFPGIRPWPVLGNALDFQNSTEIIKAALRYRRICKGNFKIYVGFQPHIFLLVPADIEFLLSSTTLLNKSQPYDYLHNWLGTGLLTATAQKWRKHRKIITPAFHFQILEDFVDVFNSASRVLIKKLDKQVETTPFNIYPYITLCTLDIICESAMGISVNAQEDSESIYVRSVQTMLKMIITRSFSPFLRYDFIYFFSKLYREERAALKILHSYTNSVIRKRKAEFMNGPKKSDEFGRRKKRAFLDLLLQYSTEEQTLTDDEIRQEADTLMFEGHDTTATAITFTLHCLAKHQGVQGKVFDEIQTVFADDTNRLPNYRDLHGLKYLEQVIKESLRMYPPVPIYSRTITEDVNCNGKTLPQGLMANVFAYGLHYDPELYPEPEKFDPGRFDPKNVKDKNHYAYLPFSAGQRNCIGQKFAMAEMKAVISNVLRRFELLPVPEHELILNSEVVLKSLNGVLVRLRRRP